MPLRRPLLCLSACLLIVLGATSARADTVVITSGSLNATGLQTFFHPFGLNVAGEGFAAAGSGEPFIYSPPDCGSGEPCAAGSVVNANGTASFSITGLCTFNYQGVGGSGPCRNSSLAFTSDPVVVPASFSGVTTHFEMTGTFLFVDGQTNQTFEVAVRGQGTATINYILWVDGSHRVSSITYNFAPEPVPEPATMLLLGTGLAGVVWRSRRRGAAREGGRAARGSD